MDKIPGFSDAITATAEGQLSTALIDRIPIALWLEDFTDVGRCLDQLRDQGVEDLSEYLDERPVELTRMIQMIRVRAVNSAAVRLLEAEEPSQLVKRIHSNTVSRESLKSFAGQLDAIWGNNDMVEVDVTGRTLKGNTFDGSVHWAAARRADGRMDLSQVVVAITDLTDLRATQRELERSNRELGEFAQVASHDLREPLRKIRQLTDLAGRTEGLSEVARSDYLERASRASGRLQRMVEDLLEYAQLGASGARRAPVDLNEVLADVVHDLEMRLAEVDGSVNVGILPVVPGDQSELHRLFLNLVDNGVKFVRAGERARVTVAVAGADGTVGDPSVHRIEVQDNGIGIPQEHVERAFGVFQRLHGRSEYPGIGMGLATVRKIADLHGGSVEVRGVARGGTCFIVVLPTLQSKCLSPSSPR